MARWQQSLFENVERSSGEASTAARVVRAAPGKVTRAQGDEASFGDAGESAEGGSGGVAKASPQRMDDWQAGGLLQAMGLGGEAAADPGLRATAGAGAAPHTPQASQAPQAPTIHDAATAAVEHKGSGQPVDSQVASRVGAHLGADLSGARVHQDPLAGEATSAMGARAFAYGSDVFLGAGESGSDLGLMAHELTHVAQQGAAGQAAPQRKVQVGEADSPAERQAEQVAAEVTSEPEEEAVAAAEPEAGQEDPEELEDMAGAEQASSEAATVEGGGGGSSLEPVAAEAGTAAAAPKSWVGSEKKVAKEKFVLGAKYPTFEAVAKAFFGRAYLASMVAKANPTLKPTRIGPKTKIKVPSSIEVPTGAKLLGDPSATGSVMEQTWNVERHPKGVVESRTPSVPSSSSGVTVGHGFDMKARSPDEIEAELKAANVDQALAKKYRGASGKQGNAAKAWIAKNKPFTSITEAQEKLLFRQEYQKATNEAVRFLSDPSRGYIQEGDDWKLQVDFANLEPKILAFLVDLKFRGDLKDSSWKYLRDAVIKNDLEALKVLVADKQGHKKHFYDNYVRYESRCKIVGASAVTERDWDKKK
jgi:Domain of unknown function (DUF4157)/Bacterial toxin homologue of phage lysozyme, C-term